MTKTRLNREKKTERKARHQMSRFSFFMTYNVNDARDYLSFFQSFVISSSVLPLVSGTSFHTNTAATMQITP